MTTENTAYGTYTALTVTNLQSLLADATDPFAAWQSAMIDFQTSVKPIDCEFRVSLPTTAHAPAGDSCAYVYLIPWVYNGSTFDPAANFGTTTDPTGSEGAVSISDPNSMKGPIQIPYKVTSQAMQLYFTLSQLCGPVVPDGVSVVIRTNNCAVGTSQGLSTGCVVAYRPITYTNA